jgi:succinate dehydrogenase/fumarate reductase flavoprotein subunit
MSDVRVIGSGGAGLAAAIAAHDAGARVTIATQLGVASCNTAKAQGGIQAAVGDDDSVETHFGDIMRSSHDTADPVLAHVLAEEGPATVQWLEELGVAFTREADGSLRIARCGGATRKRLLQVGDQTGLAIATALRNAVGERDIEVLDHAALVELAPGHAVLDRRDERIVLEPGAIILAAGGRCKPPGPRTWGGSAVVPAPWATASLEGPAEPGPGAAGLGSDRAARAGDEREAQLGERARRARRHDEGGPRLERAQVGA